ncbi:MAG TPA: type IV pilus twitching motility protein PilT [Candidatus Woesebacteria bacterium]|nr:type IV pilus twitching motility protein PilT [Candidatus Woesebacteria bacterium]
MSTTITIHDLMQKVVDLQGSDLHLVCGNPAILRVDGELRRVEMPLITPAQNKELIFSILTQEQQDYVKVNKELDFGYQYKEKARFRVNVYHASGALALAARLIPEKIKTIEELDLLPILHDFTLYPQGLVLLTGPTGEGKSTTLAALIDEINHKRAEHILTIEDPIEFIYQPDKSIISQREVNQDTHGWDIALRSALREDPDVVLIGEMRDHETIASAITIAETGHLVFATLHTNTASESMDRIIDVFPAAQQPQIRQQLAGVIRAVVSQRLLPKKGGGRVAALEVMIANAAVRNLIRESKAFQIESIIQNSSEQGMFLFEKHLFMLVQQGKITAETARNRAFRPDEIERMLAKE